MPLVLTRQMGQTISIGESGVRVAHAQGTRAELAITAPDSVRIIRSELPLIAALGKKR